MTKWFGKLAGNFLPIISLTTSSDKLRLTRTAAAEGCVRKNRKFPISAAATQPSASFGQKHRDRSCQKWQKILSHTGFNYFVCCHVVIQRNGILGCHFWKKWHYFDLWHSNGIMAFLWHFRDF